MMKDHLQPRSRKELKPGGGGGATIEFSISAFWACNVVTRGGGTGGGGGRGTMAPEKFEWVGQSMFWPPPPNG